MDDASLLFDHYVNTCVGQGSRTIRTEEAILVSLCALRPFVRTVTAGGGGKSVTAKREGV